MSLIIERRFHLANHAGPKAGYHRTLRPGEEPTPLPKPPKPGRVARIARLKALAIRCDRLLRSGAVPYASALARLTQVT